VTGSESPRQARTAWRADDVVATPCAVEHRDVVLVGHSCSATLIAQIAKPPLVLSP
jgi:hypothetical protein